MALDQNSPCPRCGSFIRRINEAGYPECNLCHYSFARHTTITKGQDVEEDRMLKWFKFDHLPEALQAVSAPFYAVAEGLCATVEAGPERTVALRKLLEAKDAAVRAKVHPGG